MTGFTLSPALSPATGGLHMRALIREAVVRLIKADPACAPLLGDRVWPNRFEAWLTQELPAAGVYTTREEVLESDTSPDPDERRLSLEVELVAWADASLDDTLDALCLALEHALTRDHAIDALGREMTALVEARLKKTLPLLKNGRSPVDTLIALKATGTDIGIAVDGERQIGVATLALDIDYTWPRPTGELADFLLAIGYWDTAPADGKVDMVSRVEFPPPDKDNTGATAPAPEED